MMHNKNYHQKVLCVKMILKYLRMFFINGPTDRIKLTDQLINNYALRNEKKCLLGRYVFFCRETHKLSVLPKCHRVVNSWVFGPIQLKPSVEFFVYVQIF